MKGKSSGSSSSNYGGEAWSRRRIFAKGRGRNFKGRGRNFRGRGGNFGVTKGNFLDDQKQFNERQQFGRGQRQFMRPPLIRDLAEEIFRSYNVIIVGNMVT